MTLKQRLGLFLLRSKESQARMITNHMQVGKAVHTPANYESFARNGYSKNLVVYSAISKITTACKGINWCLYSKSKSGRAKLTEIESHKLLTLMERPNALQAKASFVESVIGFKLIAGNSYVEMNMGAKEYGEVLELWPVRPDKMKVIAGQDGYPQAYLFSHGGKEIKWPVHPTKLTSKIMHLKAFNPLNDWYGLSALEAAMLTLDQNNFGQSWNLALFQNSATPSGVLQIKATDSNPRGTLTNEQYERLKDEFEDAYQGAKNAQRPLLLEGGLNWQTISLSPREMDFLKSREATAIDLCVALGVPPEIMGLGQKTFSNYAEGRLAFYEETVLPTMDDFRDSLNASVVPTFGENLYLDYDRDDIEALGVRRMGKFASLKDVPFLTINEKREQCGYDEIEGGDELDRPSAPAVEDETEDEEIEDEETEETVKPPKDEDSDDEDDKGFSWKAINLLNRNEKKQSWKKQNARRKQLAHGFAKDVRAEFKDLSETLGRVARELKGRENQVITFALNKAASDWAEKELAKSLRKNIRLTLEDFGGMVLGEAKSLGLVREEKANVKYDNFIKSYVERHTAKQISTINSNNEKTIRRVVSKYVEATLIDGDSSVELADMLQNKFSELSDSSAARIARTEVGMASNNGTLNAVKSIGAPNMFKEWVSASDGRVRDGDNGGADHEFVNGQEQALDDKFSVPPDCDMDGPGDNSAPADQVINCRCVLTFRSKN